MADPTRHRIDHIDWMRGLACLLMFQTHGYDAWLSDSARQSKVFWWSRIGGTMPAPLFLFLSGVSVALLTVRMREKGASAAQAARTMMRRGAQIFGFGLLFRLQEFLLGRPWAPWTDLFRVDVLNAIGLSIVLMGMACWVAALGLPAVRGERERSWRARQAAFSAVVAATVVLVTPPLWTTHRPHWLPWYLESYVNGIHIFDQPQTYLFPLFPWAAFAFAGLAIGFLLCSLWARRHELAAVAIAGGGGLVLIVLGLWLDASPVRLYAVEDFWHTSPSFFLIRTGGVMTLLLVGYAWCRWGPGRWRFRPLIEMGKSSLLVYWVHMEFVYGRFSILTKGRQGIPAATFGVVVILTAMVALAAIRNRTKGPGWGALALRRWPARANA